MATLIESPLTRLTPEQIEQLGREFDAIHHEVKAELGDRDRRYITSMIEMHRRLVVLARVLLLASRYRPAWNAGTTTLSLAKILENMEIGHNVMHGQWDWMNDPYINSSTWDWDSASTPEAWKHSHNYVHHTYTNIRGKDRDLGYEIMRIDPHQKWHPVYLFQPFYNLILAGFFEWGVAAHDLDFDAIRSGEKSKAEVRRQLKGMAGKARSQIVKDYVAWPLISGLAMAAVDLALEAREAGPGGRSRRPSPPRSRVAPARSGRRRRRTSPPTSSATPGHTRSFSAATSQTRPTPSARQRSPTRPRARGTSASCWARRTSRAGRSSMSSAATSATRSSITSSRTCPARGTPRSRRACARSANATNCPTTPGRSASSSAPCSARSSGWRSRAESPAPSLVPTEATTT